MVSDRIFDDGTTAAAAAEDAELQAAIDAFMPPRGASTATDNTLWGTAEDWQGCHYDNTPYPPDHPGSEERMAATDRHLAEEFARLQPGWLAAAAAAANDPFAVAEEAATFAACDQAKVNIRVIDRRTVAVPNTFARGVPLFFVADPNFVYLAHPQGVYGAKPKWKWDGRVRDNRFKAFIKDDDYGVYLHAYKASKLGYPKLWTIKRQRHRHGNFNDEWWCDLLALKPWPLFLTDVNAAKITAQLCYLKANEHFTWVPVAKDIDRSCRFNGET